MVVDIPDTRTMFGSAVRCKMVMGCKIDDSNRREEDSQRYKLSLEECELAQGEGEVGKAQCDAGEWHAEGRDGGTDDHSV